MSIEMPQIKPKTDCPFWGTLGGCDLLTETICKTRALCGFYPPTAAKRVEKVRQQRAKARQEMRLTIEHPVIKNLEGTGSPTGKELEAPICPMCGAETDTFLKTVAREIVGCEQCVKPVDAWDYTE